MGNKMNCIMYLFVVIHLCQLCISVHHIRRKNTRHHFHLHHSKHHISNASKHYGTERKFVSRIIGGAKADIAQFPSIAALVIENVWGFDFRGGATIISEHWIVTAAHCMVFISDVDVYAKSAFVHSNSKYWNANYSRHVIIQTHIHEKYNSDLTDFDIALAKVNQPFSGRFEKPIRIADVNYNYIVGSSVTTVGWGTTDPESAPFVTDDIRHVNVSLVNPEKCRKAYKKQNNIITQQMICASSPGKDACVNDSGGPLYQDNTLVGIVSWGATACADEIYPGVYTKIAVLKEWIKIKMKQKRATKVDFC